jgi:H+-translocating NAD(P) transhydrogenase subunit beta
MRSQRILNGAVLLMAVALGVYIVAGDGASAPTVGLFFALALAFGVMMTVPIGGADMPVVISLCNAFTGLAVGLEGLVLQNPALMIAGMVVGAAGTLLTLLMARAMNRSVGNVLLSNFGDVAIEQQNEVSGRLKPVEASDAAIAMRYAGSVIVVPGYGLAVAQAQQKLFEFVQLLQTVGVDVKFAIHPVAGRMPGHMDVLLAEAGVPYDLIHELDEINDDFKTTDVALVIGANDVVNAGQAHQVYVIKRGQGKGYAGIENELFYADNCEMVYGDAQAVLVKMIQAVKDLGETIGQMQAAA